MTSTVPAPHGADHEPTVDDLLELARGVEPSDIGRARSMVQQARVMARARHDLRGEAEALYHLAELSYLSGLNNEAFAVALEARDLAHQCGATATEVKALNLIAAVQYQATNFSDALASAHAALELYRSTGERSNEGLLLNSLAVIQHGLRETDRAIVAYEAALMANKGQDRPDLDAITLANMAKVRADRHEDLLAVSLGESALELAKVHAQEFVPEILARLATAYVALSALDRAASCLDEADGVLRDRTERRVALSPGSVVTVRTARGDLYVSQHLREHALREWSDALDLATHAGMIEVALTLREKLAQLCKEMGRFEQALFHQEARYTLNEELFNRGNELRMRTLQIQHDTEAARAQSELLRLRTTDLDQMVARRTDDIESFQVEALLRVAVLAEFRDSDAVEHPVRVGDLAADIADELGEPAEVVSRLRYAARLHDIGKVAIHDQILLKTGALTADEFATVKSHTALGREMLAGSPSAVIAMAAEVAYAHHERWDGTGYPGGLCGELIPLSGRIVAVADVYDALISERAYKHSWSSLDAINHIVAGRGTMFDPRVVSAFIAVMLRREPRLVSQLDRSALA
ncbi:MAG: HD-GYP domain-containing protein [Ilumatobacteraceae bacterium]